MKEILNKLIGHQLLTREESRQVLINMAQGNYNISQTAAFLTVYMMRLLIAYWCCKPYIKNIQIQ